MLNISFKTDAGTRWLLSYSHGFELGKKSKSKNSKTGEVTEVFIALGYYSTLESTLKAMMSMKVRESDCTSLQDLCKLVVGIDKELKQLTKGL